MNAPNVTKTYQEKLIKILGIHLSDPVLDLVRRLVEDLTERIGSQWNADDGDD